MTAPLLQEAAPLPRAAPWSLAHALWLCPFRPFFALTMLSAWLLMGLCAGELRHGRKHEAGHPRQHEAQQQLVRLLVLLWLLGRLAFWCSGWWPGPALALSALAHLGLLAGLMALLAPRLWRDPDRRHLSFFWTLLALAGVVSGFYVDALRDVSPARWLHLLVGVFMALVVVAMSRISMSIVNASIDDLAARQSEELAPYLARPPRRNLALLTIALFTLAEFWQAGGPVSGWLALAAACALLNLLNDWHVGRPLLRRWPLMLYAVYLLMAGGYALIGVAVLSEAFSPNAGLHLLTTGVLGLSIYVVICIAGYTHSGLEKGGRAWVPLGAMLLVASALLRVGAYAGQAQAMMGAAALLWGAAFLLQSAHMLPVFWRPRADGASGCAGITTS